MDLNAPGLISLTKKEEHGSYQKANENVRNGAFDEWPNEAGVGLHPLFTHTLSLPCPIRVYSIHSIILDCPFLSLKHLLNSLTLCQFTNLEEHRGPIELKLTGAIPAWAAGSLYRTGPGISEVETGKGLFKYSHWFDGLAHTHRFEIVADGDRARVFYSSRRQSDHIAESIRRNGTLRSITFAQRADPCVGLLGKAMSVFRRDKALMNVSVTVQPDLTLPAAAEKNGVNGNGNGVNGKAKETVELGHRGQAESLYLATDAAFLSRVDPSTLEPLGLVEQSALHPDLKGTTSAAHGKRDPLTGDFFNFNLELGMTPTYRIFQIVAATGEVRILATLRGKGVRPGYIHSFFITEGYVVLCVTSLRHVGGGAMVPIKGNILEALAFEEVPCDWYVVDRRGDKGVVGEFRTPRGFFFHSVNAWEEGGDVVTEAVWYDDAEILYSLYYEVLRDEGGKGAEFWKDRELNARLTRYRLPVASGVGGKNGENGESKVRVEDGIIQPELEIAGPLAGELPTYNTRYATRKHRYVYGVASRGLSTMFDAIAKTDTAEGSAVLWRPERGHTPGEAIFVARPGAAAEDDGVLLSVVLDGLRGRSYLLCLDAGTMEEVGRAEVGFAVGFGFHGRLVAPK